jgi:hypothetical protein
MGEFLSDVNTSQPVSRTWREAFHPKRVSACDKETEHGVECVMPVDESAGEWRLLPRCVAFCRRERACAAWLRPMVRLFVELQGVVVEWAQDSDTIAHKYFSAGGSDSELRLQDAQGAELVTIYFIPPQSDDDAEGMMVFRQPQLALPAVYADDGGLGLTADEGTAPGDELMRKVVADGQRESIVDRRLMRGRLEALVGAPLATTTIVEVPSDKKDAPRVASVAFAGTHAVRDMTTVLCYMVRAFPVATIELKVALDWRISRTLHSAVGQRLTVRKLDIGGFDAAPDLAPFTDAVGAWQIGPGEYLRGRIAVL